MSLLFWVDRPRACLCQLILVNAALQPNYCIKVFENSITVYIVYALWDLLV